MLDVAMDHLAHVPPDDARPAHRRGCRGGRTRAERDLRRARTDPDRGCRAHHGRRATRARRGAARRRASRTCGRRPRLWARLRELVFGALDGSADLSELGFAPIEGGVPIFGRVSDVLALPDTPWIRAARYRARGLPRDGRLVRAGAGRSRESGSRTGCTEPRLTGAREAESAEVAELLSAESRGAAQPRLRAADRSPTRAPPASEHRRRQPAAPPSRRGADASTAASPRTTSRLRQRRGARVSASSSRRSTRAPIAEADRLAEGLARSTRGR